MRILGIDCEGVIFHFHGKSVPGSLENLRKIVRSNRFDKIYIVSRARMLTRFYFLARLWYLNFWHYTGISRHDIYFCRRDEKKADICKQLKISHFIDDRFEVLRHLTTVEKKYALDPTPRSIRRFARSNPDVVVAGSWEELIPVLIRH